MIRNKIKILRNKFIKHKIDGYIIPKNDEFFFLNIVKKIDLNLSQTLVDLLDMR